MYQHLFRISGLSLPSMEAKTFRSNPATLKKKARQMKNYAFFVTWKNQSNLFPTPQELKLVSKMVRNRVESVRGFVGVEVLSHGFLTIVQFGRFEVAHDVVAKGLQRRHWYTLVFVLLLLAFLLLEMLVNVVKHVAPSVGFDELVLLVDERAFANGVRKVERLIEVQPCPFVISQSLNTRQ